MTHTSAASLGRGGASTPVCAMSSSLGIASMHPYVFNLHVGGGKGLLQPCCLCWAGLRPCTTSALVCLLQPVNPKFKRVFLRLGTNQRKALSSLITLWSRRRKYSCHPDLLIWLTPAPEMLRVVEGRHNGHLCPSFLCALLFLPSASSLLTCPGHWCACWSCHEGGNLRDGRCSPQRQTWLTRRWGEEGFFGGITE